MALLSLAEVSGLAESKPLELRWSELEPVITGRRAAVLLTDGRTIKGEVVAVRGDSLLMDARSASGTPIPRQSINLIKLEKGRGSWGRGMGTTLGVLTGVPVGAYVAATQARSGGAGVAIFVTMAAAITTGGYFVGRNLDKRISWIKIVP
jgi:hypothetical protein